MTSIVLPGTPSIGGFAEWGKVPVAVMIAAHRLRAERMRADAEAILSASDDDFRIDTYVGPIAMRDRQVIQQGRERSTSNHAARTDAQAHCGGGFEHEGC